MSGAEELPWIALGIMGGSVFLIVWALILAKGFIWLLPKIFPELKDK